MRLVQVAVITMDTIQLEGRQIGQPFPTFIIAEIAQAHDGSLGMAHAFIDAVAKAGADAVKFQTHIARAESTLDEPFRIKFSCQDASRYDYWQRIEFSPEQWAELAAHSRDRKLLFLSSAFSLEAVALLQSVGMSAWKVGSGELWSRDLIEAMSRAGGPLLLSTGLATIADIGDVVGWCTSKLVPYALLQCTTAYPTRLEEVGLNVLDQLRHEFKCPVGLSDHSGSIYAGLAAIARGADILEVHVTFHRDLFGPDVTASVTIEELKMLRAMRDTMATLDSNPVDKSARSPEIQALREKFGKSLVTVRRLPAGTILLREMLTTKKPGGGIPPGDVDSVVGRRLIREAAPDRILRKEDVEGW